MSFARPWVLLFLPLLVALAGWAARRRPPAVYLPSLMDLGSAVGRAARPPVPPLLLEALGAVGLLFALAGPQQLATVEHEHREALDMVLALDISGSMGAYDAPPGTDPEELADAVRTGKLRSRLAVAKDELVRFVDARPEDRIGLLVFSQRPYLACPPTFDHDFLRRRLGGLETGLVADGTGLAGAIVSGMEQLRDSAAPRRVLVLFTDGEDNVDAPLTPLQAAALAKDAGVVLYTVGIGGGEAYIRRPGLVSDRYMSVPSDLHADLLRLLAEQTAGQYLPATDAAGLARALRRIDDLERVPIEHLVSHRASDRSSPALVASLALVLAGLFARSTRWLTVP
jgi:Ca-activated chloride channel family protein